MNDLEASRLEARGITKRYPGVVANDGIDFAVAKGEIHAILGENGAGKSTLVKMIYGLEKPDAGAFWFEGRKVAIDGPRAARRLGVGMVFQHFSLIDALTVRENLALAMEDVGGSALDEAIRALMARYGLHAPLDKVVGTASVGEKQRVEIVRALLFEPKLLIMDEPTSVLSPSETGRLFDVLRAMRGEGRSILYISHKLAEIEALCDRVTILRAGKVAHRVDPRLESARSLAEKMVGETLRHVEKGGARASGGARLAARGLSMKGEGDFGVDLIEVELIARGGEVFGIAGVAGNGQRELWQALAGERLAPRADAIAIDGRSMGRSGIEARRAVGLCAAPEERSGHAAAAAFSLEDNLLISARGRNRLAPFGVIDRGATRAATAAVIDRFGVKAGGTTSPAGALSGGNLQKFLVGREIEQRPGVLVASQPTWGVDAASAARIRQALIDLARDGCAVVVISQDLDELLAIADRIAVLHRGRLSEPLDAANATPAALGLLMGGVRLEENGDAA